MKIFVINTGSSSIKYQLFQMADSQVLASGLLERIGESTSKLKHQSARSPEAVVREKVVPDHEQGLREIVDLLTDPTIGVIRDTSDVAAIGHRVVHGGEAFKRPTRIDQKVIQAIEEHIPLAPLHNPANLTGIRAALKYFPSAPQVAIFDTAFHQTIPRHAYHYAIPDEYYRKLKIRRYGFHGTSHFYVAKKAAELLGKPLQQLNLITIHLGNGCSMAAIQNGKSVDTSMGMTPLEGLIMGTRCGDIDPAIHFYLVDHSTLQFRDVDKLLNKESGLKGLTGTNDLRDVMQMREAGNGNAELAVRMFAYRIKKYIGAYYAVLGRLDGIVFTAGIGENSPEMRRLSTAGLEALGIEVSDERNAETVKSARFIQGGNSRVAVMVVPTNEELEIALQTQEVIEG
ncbi:MAG: acetate kinase [Nitrospinae bacterium]|nr:acetate kinase [Nitrospinota bacterium]